MNLPTLPAESSITISQQQYDELVQRSEILAALEQGGVDNWEWYGQSLKDYFGEEEPDNEDD